MAGFFPLYAILLIPQVRDNPTEQTDYMKHYSCYSSTFISSSLPSVLPLSSLLLSLPLATSISSKLILWSAPYVDYMSRDCLCTFIACTAVYKFGFKKKLWSAPMYESQIAYSLSTCVPFRSVNSSLMLKFFEMVTPLIDRSCRVLCSPTMSHQLTIFFLGKCGAMTETSPSPCEQDDGREFKEGTVERGAAVFDGTKRNAIGHHQCVLPFIGEVTECLCVGCPPLYLRHG